MKQRWVHTVIVLLEESVVIELCRWDRIHTHITLKRSAEQSVYADACCDCWCIMWSLVKNIFYEIMKRVEMPFPESYSRGSCMDPAEKEVRLEEILERLILIESHVWSRHAWYNISDRWELFEKVLRRKPISWGTKSTLADHWAVLLNCVLLCISLLTIIDKRQLK